MSNISTNLPITLELYRNQLPTATGATNILGSPTLRQDADGAWYRVYSETTLYEMDFNEDVTELDTGLFAFHTIDMKWIPVEANATKIGLPICLNTETSMDLELYYHEDYPNRILVDKYISNLKKACRRCGNVVAPSDVIGYPYVCYTCDENMFEFEVYESEE